MELNGINGFDPAGQNSYKYTCNLNSVKWFMNPWRLSFTVAKYLFIITFNALNNNIAMYVMTMICMHVRNEFLHTVFIS